MAEKDAAPAFPQMWKYCAKPSSHRYSIFLAIVEWRSTLPP